MTETWSRRTLSCSISSRGNTRHPSLSVIASVRGKVGVVRDFRVHLGQCWNSHLIANMKEIFVHAHALLFHFLPYEKALIVRELPEGIISNHIFLTRGIPLLLTWSVPDMSANITLHLERFLLISWVHILFPQVHRKIINGKVYVSYISHCIPNTPENVSLWPPERTHK